MSTVSEYLQVTGDWCLLARERGSMPRVWKFSCRALDAGKSEPYEPYHTHTSSEPVTPGEINEYNVGLGVMTHVFKVGHRIKLVIESLESPCDPEMQIHYHPHLNSSKTTLHKIYRNKEYRSHLLLPVTKEQTVTEMLSDENLL